MHFGGGRSEFGEFALWWGATCEYFHPLYYAYKTEIENFAATFFG